MSNKYYCVSKRYTGAVNGLRVIVTAFIWVILRGMGLLTDLLTSWLLVETFKAAQGFVTIYVAHLSRH